MSNTRQKYDEEFKKNAVRFFFKLPYSDESINCVSRKSGDELCDDKVDLARYRIVYHTIESVTLSGAGSGNGFIGVDACEIPILPFIYVLYIMINLCRIA